MELDAMTPEEHVDQMRLRWTEIRGVPTIDVVAQYQDIVDTVRAAVAEERERCAQIIRVSLHATLQKTLGALSRSHLDAMLDANASRCGEGTTEAARPLGDALIGPGMDRPFQRRSRAEVATYYRKLIAEAKPEVAVMMVDTAMESLKLCGCTDKEAQELLQSSPPEGPAKSEG